MRAVFCGSVLAIAAAGPGLGATYSFKQLESYSFTGGSGVSQEYSINDQGVIFDNISVTNQTTSFQLRSRSVSNLGQETIQGFLGNHPQGNDAGEVLGTTVQQIVTNGQTNTITNLVVAAPDGNQRLLATASFLNPGSSSTPAFKEIFVFGASINDHGDVAARVRTFDDNSQIVKFNADGTHEVIVTDTLGFPAADEVGFSTGATQGRVVINNQGTVAFAAGEFNANGNTVSQGYWVAEDADSLRELLPAPNGVQANSDFDFNDRGDLAFNASFGGVFSDIGFYDAASGETTVTRLGSTADVGSVNNINLNDYGQIAHVLNGELYLDGEKLLGVGDTPLGENEPLMRSGGSSPVGLREKVSLNNLGHIVANVQTRSLDPETGEPLPNFPTNFTLLANPDGGSVDNPLMPFASTPEGENDIALNIVNGLGVDAPIWVDPIVATGFTYTQGAGGANFASLIIPDALPLGDDMFTLEFMYGAGDLFSGVLGVGSIFDFTAYDSLGISEFTIGGIDVGEMVDPTDPFIVGLTFVSGGFSSTLSIDAITVDTDAMAPVPLPASLPLVLGGLLAFGWFGRRRLG